MAGGEGRNGEVVPLTIEQVLELLESSTADPPLVSPAALLCRVEDLLLRGTGATSVDAFLVDRWFNKLLHFSAVTDSATSDGKEEEEEAAAAAAAAAAVDRTNGALQGQLRLRQQQQTQRQQQRPRQRQQHGVVFDTRAVCDIGDGIVGMAAMTGRKLRVRDCRARQGRRPENPVYSTDFDSGSLICWPVRSRTSSPSGASRGGVRVAAPADERPPFAQLEDVEVDAERNDQPATALEAAEGVLAVIQVRCADGELSAEAVEVLHGIGRLVVPLLTEALARDEEYVRRRSTEALLSLNSIVPREMGLIAMIEEVVRVAQRLTEAERVCFFFVDEAADELWVAKSVDFDDAKIKIGQGLCGHAAATGGIVNVIDSYKDSRFDRSWDQQTGFVTKSVLCVPIPPPDHDPDRGTLGSPRAAATAAAAASGSSSGGLGGGAGGGGRRGVGWAGGGVEWPSKSEQSQEQPLKWARGRSDPGASTGVERPPPPLRHRRSSEMSATPLAVLEVINKRGTGVFGKHDEGALVRLCACVESLLRKKAAEVALLWSGMTERSLLRKGNGQGGACGASSNHARLETSMMRLYSKVPLPADSAALGEHRARNGNVISAVSSPGSDYGGGGGGGERVVSEGNLDGRGGHQRSASDGNIGGVEPGQGSETDDTNRRRGSDSAVLEGSAGVGDVGGVDRMLAGDTVQEDSELVDLSMNLFDLSSEQLLSLVGRFFRNMGLTDMFQISDEKMRSFVTGVEGRYHPHTFHNLFHAVSVTHVSFVIIKTTQVNSLLRPLDKLALLVAAFCHDIDHPGNNNDYEVNSLSPLALQHGDSSVLERHHVFVAFQVLLQEGGANNIFSELTRAQFRDVRRTIVQAILGTDMSSHMQHCAEVFQFAQKVKRLRAGRAAAVATRSMMREGKDREGRVISPATARKRFWGVVAGAMAKGTGEIYRAHQDGADAQAHKRSKSGTRMCGTSDGAGGGGGACNGSMVLSTPQPGSPPPNHIFSVDRAEDRSFLTQTIVHCADLSGQVLDNPLALEWGRRILEEFRLQARLEASAGLPLSTVASEDLETTMKGQHFFAAKIVKPLWEPFVVLFPRLSPLLENLNCNCDYYFQEGLRLETQRLSAVPGTSNKTESTDNDD